MGLSFPSVPAWLAWPASHRPATQAERIELVSGLKDLIGPAICLAILLLVFATLEPFQDRLSAAMLNTRVAGDLANQIAFPLAFLVAFCFVAATKPGYFKLIYHPILIIVTAWLVLTVLTSADPLLSARRMSFNLVAIAIAAMIFALPRSLSELPISSPSSQSWFYWPAGAASRFFRAGRCILRQTQLNRSSRAIGAASFRTRTKLAPSWCCLFFSDCSTHACAVYPSAGPSLQPPVCS